MRRQRAVELDRHHAARLTQQLRGEDAQSRPDLQHEIVAADARLAHHPLHDATFEEEVLAETLVRPDAELGHQPGPLAARGRNPLDGIEGGEMRLSIRLNHGTTSIPAPATTSPIRHSDTPASSKAAWKASAWAGSTARRRPPEVWGSKRIVCDVASTSGAKRIPPPEPSK